MKLFVLVILLSSNCFADDHIRKGDIVSIKNKDTCLTEEDFFNSCDKVEKFKVFDLGFETYRLEPTKKSKTCEELSIKRDTAKQCLKKE